MLSLEVAILSERGGRTTNEDACGHWHSDRHLVCVLADGAGGHGGGDIASRLAVQEMLHGFASDTADDGDRLRTLVLRTNEAVLDAQRQGGARGQMHSTLVCLVVDFVAHRACWAHAGDSRLYWFRGGRIVERTRDHSLVQALVDAGLLAAEQLRTHAQRSELRSALGSQQGDFEVESRDPAEVAAGDAFLLCSDGLWEHLDDAEIEAALAGADGPRDWLARLEARLTEATREVPRHDNYSGLAVWLGAPQGAA